MRQRSPSRLRRDAAAFKARQDAGSAAPTGYDPWAAATGRVEPAELTTRQLHVRITGPEAKCVEASHDPDEWFPLTADPAKARLQASLALTLCSACAVRAECLELALRDWHGAGQHGIWGGTLETERHALRQGWLAGVSVRALLHPAPRRLGGTFEPAAHAGVRRES